MKNPSLTAGQLEQAGEIAKKQFEQK